MSWRAAFLRQARSDSLVRMTLGNAGAEPSHRLHYLQMMSEKLAKGLLAAPDAAAPPALTHRAFVRLLQTIKQNPTVRERLGYADAQIFRSMIDSLLALAAEVESLAPSAAGTSRPNPEYPWLDRSTNRVIAPVDFDFPLFDPRDPKMIKLVTLIDALIRIET